MSKPNLGGISSKIPEKNIISYCKKKKTSTSFKVLAIGDIQIGSSEELLYAANSILKEVNNRDDYDLTIYLGDLVNDTPELFSSLKTMIENTEKMYRVVYGNHDRNFSSSQESQTDLFRNYFGPENYAFYKNGILFITLNSITPKGSYGYDETYPNNQLRFISQLLKNVPKSTPIVINQHVPLLFMTNKDSLIQILDSFKKTLLLSGHTHTVFQNYIKTPSGNTIHELTAGASCGNWWRGQKDWEGTPTSLMQCGTPKGYFEIDFNGNDYKLTYKGVGLPKEKQSSLWVDTYKGSPTSFVSKNREIYLNVFAGSEKTKVEIHMPDGTILPMKKTREMDPFVHYIQQSQKSKNAPDKDSQVAPYTKRNSPHLWKVSLPETLQSGGYSLKFTITDEKLNPIETSYWIWIE